MKQAEKYLKEGVDLTVFNLKEITFEDLEQLVLDTYNDAYHETVKNLSLSGVVKSFYCHDKTGGDCNTLGYKQCEQCKEHELEQ